MKVQTCLIAALGLAATTAAQAQNYPSKTITLVVTAAPGGVTDVVARGIGQRMAKDWGTQVVIENKGGGAHIIGAQGDMIALFGGFKQSGTGSEWGEFGFEEFHEVKAVLGFVEKAA